MQTTSVTLRDVPVSLYRRIKARAVERGEPIGRVVTEALSAYLADAPLPQSAGDEQSSLLRAGGTWYRAHKDEVERAYRGQYAAVTAEGVVDSGRDLTPLLRRLRERFGREPVFVRRIGQDTVHVRSPRVNDPFRS